MAELDIAIDDWVLKLEQAEHRRWEIQQKLLEHVAATLTVVDSTAIRAGNNKNTRAPQQTERVIKGNQTPPTTSQEPILTDESLICNSSISHSHSHNHSHSHSHSHSGVHADTGVAVLLSAIEDEILLMQQTGPVRAATC